jgi:hypothetical protein
MILIGYIPQKVFMNYSMAAWYAGRGGGHHAGISGDTSECTMRFRVSTVPVELPLIMAGSPAGTAARYPEPRILYNNYPILTVKNKKFGYAAGRFQLQSPVTGRSVPVPQLMVIVGVAG